MKTNEPVFSRIKGITLLTLFALTPVPAQVASGDFTPLLTSSSLDHCIGDKKSWSFQDGVLTTRGDDGPTESKLLLTTERFGNFILKFSARSADAEVRVLFGATIQPPGLVLGYEATVGGQNAGSLTLRNPAAFPKPNRAESRQAVSSFPDSLMMPFFREATEVPLVQSPSSKGASVQPPSQWVEYEIAALADHIIVKMSGITTAHYRANKSLEEGMLGFRIPPGKGMRVELKDIQVQLFGDVHWPTEAPAGDLTTVPAEGWKASPPSFKRMSDEAWSQESRELLGIAGNDGGFHPLFDGKTLEGWRDATSFWSAQNGLIEGFSRNSFLVTEKQYSNFILKGSLRLSPPDGNSGIQVRSSVIQDGMKGYQFDVGIPWWGQLYSESTQRGILVPVEDRMSRIKLVHTDGWNDFTIICKGDHLIGKLNGEVTYDLVDYYGEKTGRIGVQIHVGPPMRVEFRNLEIKELP
jgi:3-keto-disaccharide hydrolase